jgi:hypothetical protein
MISTGDVRAYYQNVDVSPAFERLGDEFWKWRQVRVRMASGRFLKLRRTFSGWKDLFSTLAKLSRGYDYPFKVYYTVARWLSPERVGPRELRGRPGYLTADNLFLKQDDFVVDLDDRPWEDLLIVLEWLESHSEFKLNYIIESGGGGIHVSFRRPFDGAALSPSDREKLAEQMNIELVNELKDAGVAVDSIITNPRQIVKVPLSLDAQSGRACRFIDSRSPVRGRTQRDADLDDAKNRQPLRRPIVKQGRRRRAGVSPSSAYLAVRSSVCGTKGLHVPILELGQELDSAEQIVRELVRRFRLGDVYLFDDGKKIVGLDLKPVSLRRHQKIQDGKDLRTYKSRLLFLNELVYLGKVTGVPTNHRSLGHSLLMRMLGVDCLLGCVGKPRVKLVKLRPEE